MRKQDKRSTFLSFPPKQVLARAVQPVVTELLEQRRLYAVTASLSAGVLTISGDNSDNQIVIYQDSGGLIKARTTTGGVITTLSDPTWDSAEMTSIAVNAYGGADYIEMEIDIDHFYGPAGVDLPCDMYGGGTTDTLYGGDYADTIAGGFILYGRGGNDVMHGTETGDHMDGGDGNDLMYGSSGNDDMTGGPGSDTMYGELGDDTFAAASDGSGDYVDGGSGSDSASRDFATDTLVSVETIL